MALRQVSQVSTTSNPSSIIRPAFFNYENIQSEVIPKVPGFNPLDDNHKVSLLQLMKTVYNENIRGQNVATGVGGLNSLVIRRMNDILKHNLEASQKAPPISTTSGPPAPKNFVIRASSSARDVSAYPYSYQFRTYLSGTNNTFGMDYAGSMPALRNVKSIEVIGAIVPNLSLLNAFAFVEPLVVVKLNEIDTLGHFP
jgi:hypothetical protein